MKFKIWKCIVLSFLPWFYLSLKYDDQLCVWLTIYRRGWARSRDCLFGGRVWGKEIESEITRSIFFSNSSFTILSLSSGCFYSSMDRGRKNRLRQDLNLYHTMTAGFLPFPRHQQILLKFELGRFAGFHFHRIESEVVYFYNMSPLSLKLLLSDILWGIQWWLKSVLNRLARTSFPGWKSDGKITSTFDVIQILLYKMKVIF